LAPAAGLATSASSRCVSIGPRTSMVGDDCIVLS